jgi:hypothetical protein
VLERQTLPVLLVFGIDQGDLYPCIDPDGEVWEPCMLLEQQQQWQPLERFRTQFWDIALFRFSDWMGARYSESERFDNILRLNEAYDSLKYAGALVPGFQLPVDLEARRDHLSFMAFGSSSVQDMPLEVMIPLQKLDAIKPRLAQATSIFVSGATLIKNKENNKIEGAECDVVVLGRNLNRIEAVNGVTEIAATANSASGTGGLEFLPAEPGTKKAFLIGQDFLRARIRIKTPQPIFLQIRVRDAEDSFDVGGRYEISSPAAAILDGDGKPVNW